MTPKKRDWNEFQNKISVRIEKDRRELIRDLQEVGNGRLFPRI